MPLLPSRNVTRSAVTVPERENSPAPNEAPLARKSTSVMSGAGVADRAADRAAELASKPTASRVTLAPSLNNAPPPLAVIVSHGLQLAKFSSRPSVPPVNVNSRISSGPAVALRIRSGRPWGSRL